MARPQKSRVSAHLLLSGTALLLIGGVVAFHTYRSRCGTAGPHLGETSQESANAAQPTDSTSSYPRQLLEPRRLQLRDDGVCLAAAFEFGPPPLAVEAPVAPGPATVELNTSGDPWYDASRVEGASPNLVAPQVQPSLSLNPSNDLRRLPPVEQDSVAAVAPLANELEPRRLPPVEEVEQATDGPEIAPSSPLPLQVPDMPQQPPLDDPMSQREFIPSAPPVDEDGWPITDSSADVQHAPLNQPSSDGSAYAPSNDSAFPGFDGSQWTPDTSFAAEESPESAATNPPSGAAHHGFGPDPAMAAVSQQAMETVQYGISLAERGATHSARAQFIQALRMVSQALDATETGTAHSDGLAKGLRALEEAEDFVPRGSQLEADMNVESIIAAHRTPIFKGQEPPSALVALQRYYTYAQDKLADAAGATPAGSMALFGLGKLYAVQPGQTPEQLRLSAPKAMALHHAALTTDARNFRAANELGVLLARYGQLQDARGVLLHGLSLHATPSMWHNLSVVHERLGEVDLARRAKHEYELALQQAPNDPLLSPVQWVSPETFAQTSHGGIDLPVHPPASASAAPATSRRGGPPGRVGASLWSSR
ncbi:MAG: hypothetical protein RIC55_26710 [Pirellulaceae bacterium]